MTFEEFAKKVEEMGFKVIGEGYNCRFLDKNNRIVPVIFSNDVVEDLVAYCDISAAEEIYNIVLQQLQMIG